MVKVGRAEANRDKERSTCQQVSEEPLANTIATRTTATQKPICPNHNITHATLNERDAGRDGLSKPTRGPTRNWRLMVGYIHIDEVLESLQNNGIAQSGNKAAGRFVERNPKREAGLVSGEAEGQLGRTDGQDWTVSNQDETTVKPETQRRGTKFADWSVKGLWPLRLVKTVLTLEPRLNQGSSFVALPRFRVVESSGDLEALKK